MPRDAHSGSYTRRSTILGLSRHTSLESIQAQPQIYHPVRSAEEDKEDRVWFDIVDRDKSGRITATELQQAIINPKHGAFRLQTCALLIQLFRRGTTKVQSESLSFDEFSSLRGYIESWTELFEHFDRDKNGKIEFEELVSALWVMGYTYSEDIVRSIHFKFSSGNDASPREMYFDGLIQACVAVKMLSDSFKHYSKPDMKRTQWITKEDFLWLAFTVPDNIV